MAKRYKVMTILGTRPEIIRLSEVIKRLDRDYEHVLVHTGQNYDYELNEIFFEQLGLRRPDYYLDAVGKDLGDTMGQIISKSYELLLKAQPDAVLILGDTNSALSAISARRLKIPLFHMEAGNRCWDLNVAEMTNRTIVDHISDLNMPYSRYAYQNLVSEGLSTDWLLRTGSPMREVINAHKVEIESSDILTREGLEPGKYIVISCHREENVDIEDKFYRILPALNKICDELKMPAVFSTHPRTRNRLEQRGFALSKYIREDKPFGFFDYCKLEKNAYVVLSDSGTLTEESSILKFPAVLIRTSTERQEGLLHGSIALGGVDYKTIRDSITFVRNMYEEHKEPKDIIPDYANTDVSEILSKAIGKYIPLIKKKTWLEA